MLMFLKVNGAPMTGKPQEEVVAFLRKIPVNENVILLVARAAKSLYIPSLVCFVSYCACFYIF